MRMPMSGFRPRLAYTKPSLQVLNPSNSVRWHHEVLRWLDEWVGDSSLITDGAPKEQVSSSFEGLRVQTV